MCKKKKKIAKKAIKYALKIPEYSLQISMCGKFCKINFECTKQIHNYIFTIYSLTNGKRAA